MVSTSPQPVRTSSLIVHFTGRPPRALHPDNRSLFEPVRPAFFDSLGDVIPNSEFDRTHLGNR